MSIAVPIGQEHIDTANEMRNRLRGFVLAEKALDKLSGLRPADAPECILAKATALNALYSTRIFGIQAMADRLRAVLDRPRGDYRKVVRAICKPLGGRAFGSFASKYVHFFVDPGAPILDLHSERIARLCVGRTIHADNKRQHKHPYDLFDANIRILREGSSFSASARDLDKFLWMAGQGILLLELYSGRPNGEIAKHVRPADARRFLPPRLIEIARRTGRGGG